MCVKKISVGILGATGMVGQQYVQLLANHPWFDVQFLASSDVSAGKTYEQAVFGRWHMKQVIPEAVRTMLVSRIMDVDLAKHRCSFVFSALGTDAAQMYEELYAKNDLAVISNASYHRNSLDVPILLPEVNPDHIKIISIQKNNRGWNKGFIVVKPNCSLQSYMIPLLPLHERYGVKKVFVTTLQATSGAGYPGVSSFDMIDNVIPYIAHEEEKSELEPLKIFGFIEGNRILPSSEMTIAAHCNRVPVLDGHMACVSVEFAKKPECEDIVQLWKNFQGEPQKLHLPSAPEYPLVYCQEPDRPQPRLDRDRGYGMTVSVGRLRVCPLFHVRFVALSHNTLRGAAGGGILNAEFLVKKGFLG